MNKDWVLFHPREAREELTNSIAEIEATDDYGFGEFSVAMTHLYHHLNTAWNSREALANEVNESSDDNFRRWRQFPEDLPL
jgi:hypothetical protein